MSQLEDICPAILLTNDICLCICIEAFETHKNFNMKERTVGWNTQHAHIDTHHSVLLFRCHLHCDRFMGPLYLCFSLGHIYGLWMMTAPWIMLLSFWTSNVNKPPH